MRCLRITELPSVGGRGGTSWVNWEKEEINSLWMMLI
jgi:hypothetical protein